MYEGMQSAKDARVGYAGTAMIDGPRSATPIRDALGRLEELIQQAHGGASALSERLDVVLRPSAPEPAPISAKNPVGRAVGTHLEDRILSLASAVVELNGRLQDIHGRIEL